MKEKEVQGKRKARKLQGFFKGAGIAFFSFCALFLLVVAILYAYLSLTVDTRADHERIALLRASCVTKLYYDKEEQDDLYTPCEWEEERLRGGEVRIFTPFEEMPAMLWQAFVAKRLLKATFRPARWIKIRILQSPTARARTLK